MSTNESVDVISAAPARPARTGGAPSPSPPVVSDSVELIGHAVIAAGASRKRLNAWSAGLVVLDILAVTIAVVTALLARFGLSPAQVGGIDYRLIGAVLVPVWLVALTLSGSYDSRFITSGPEQYRRVVNAGVWVLAVVALLAFAFRADLSRGFVFVALPYAAFLTVVGRFMARKALHRQYAQQRSAHTVLAIGSPAEVADLVAHIQRASHVGFRVVAAVTPGDSSPCHLPAGIRWAGGDLAAVVEQAHMLGADTLAVAGAHHLPRGALRKLSWELEGTSIELMVAPAITDLAGPRIRIRPIDGLPLLQVEKPEFTGAKRAAKEAIDRVFSTLALIAITPVLGLLATTIWMTDRGPVFYRQLRVGQDGRQFWLLKFRSMKIGAEIEAATVTTYQPQGLVFKSRDDPRITPFGRFLRRWSLDELPQLWNVLCGDMSLVGPRPLVLSEVPLYGRRRLLVKPGITGLWQVSGRSDISFEDRARLDLFYVDHWSVGLDFILLWRTVASVVRGHGAF